MKNLKTIFALLIFILSAFGKSEAQTLTISTSGSINHVDVMTATNFTATVTGLQTGYAPASYHWSCTHIGGSGNINGGANGTTTSDVNSTSTSNVAVFTYGPEDATVTDYVDCYVTVTHGSTSSPVFAGSYTIYIKGIPVTSYISGSSSVQKCCTNSVTYTCQNVGDADLYTWSTTTGWGNPIAGGTGHNYATYTPTSTTGGTVQCVMQVSTAPASYNVTKQVTVSRPDPVMTITSVSQIPCVGTYITYTCLNPCGAVSYNWNFPDAFWVVQSQMANGTVTVLIKAGAAKGNVTVTATFSGGCTASATIPQDVLTTPPGDPVFDNGCPEYDINNCEPGDKRVCATQGSTIAVIPDATATFYNCKVSSPWAMWLNSTSATYFNNITPQDIQNIVIYLPGNTSYYAVLSGGGTYSVQAGNCTGTSNWAYYVFQRENDYWCSCEAFRPCLCPPEGLDEDNTCGGGGHGQRIAGNQIHFDKISIYPNPVNQNLFIQMPDGNKNIVVADMMGRTLINKNSSDSQIEISMDNYSSGIYFITVTFNGNSVKSLINVQK